MADPITIPKAVGPAIISPIGPNIEPTPATRPATAIALSYLSLHPPSICSI